MTPTRALGGTLLVAATLVMVLTSGCAALRPDADTVPASGALNPVAVGTDAAWESLQDARRLAGRGHVGDAVAHLERLLADSPRFVPGHRLLQDLLTDSPADWKLRTRYAVDDGAPRGSVGAPDAADAAYLAARIEPDPDRQAALFERALELRPDHPWAHVGRALALHRDGDRLGAEESATRATVLAPRLAMPWIFRGSLSLGRGNAEAALVAFDEAIARDPGDVRAHLGRLAAAAELGRRSEVSASCLAALRLAPGDPVVLAAAGDALVAAGVPTALREALDLSVGSLGEVAHPLQLRELRARLRLALGDAAGAADEARLSGGGIEIARVLRRADLRRGRHVAAVEGHLSALPDEVLAPDNRYAGRWGALRAAAAAAGTTDDATSLHGLATAMLGVGWRRDAHLVLARASAMGGEPGRSAARAAAEERAFDRFLDDASALARRLRAAAAREEPMPSVQDVLVRLGQLSERRLGRSVIDGAVVRSYPFLGEFAASLASGGAFMSEFDRRGLLCLVGQRRGAGPRIVVARIVLVRAGVAADVLGEPVTFDECWVTSEGLPRGLGGLGAGLAGLTIDRLVTIQLDATLRRAVPLPEGVPVVERLGSTLADVLALDTPSAVSRRIETRLAADGLLASGLLSAVRRHELGHVLDARRMLPVTAHPLRALQLVVGNGFDGGAVEAELEARAALVALVESDVPRAALASLLAFLPVVEGTTAHARGYRDAVERAVRIIHDDRVAFPSVQADRNLLQQLDLLSDDEIRELGRRLLD